MRCLWTLLIALFFSLRAAAQGDALWIADAPLGQTAVTNLYSLCSNDQPVILVVGNIHSQATENLLQTGALQKLVREHAAPRGAVSMGDMQLAFLNIMVFDNDSAGRNFEGMQVYNLPESSEVLNGKGWEDLYNISSTNLFLLTPDHLIYPLTAENADDLYAAVRSHTSKIHPDNDPDVRLLNVRYDDASSVALVTVQNFSRLPIKHVHLSMLSADGKASLGNTDFNVSVASLDAATLRLPIQDAASLRSLQIVANVDGDTNSSNNVWTGSLRSGTGTIASAGISTMR